MFKEEKDCAIDEFKAQELYIQLLRTANNFLINAEHFDIQVLQESNPTYEELGKLALKVAQIIRVLVDDFDPWMHQKALEYASLMAGMGKAIKDGDEVELERIVDELNGKPML